MIDPTGGPDMPHAPKRSPRLARARTRLVRPDRERARSVLPMQLRAGDRFTDEEGEWEVIGGPSTLHGGKTVQARVRRLGDRASERDMTWPAHEKLMIRRAAP